MKKIGFLLTMSLALCLWPPPCAHSFPRGRAELAERIDALLGKPGLQRVRFSACVVSVESGEVIYEKNPRCALIPASNMKIVTTAAALETLGRDFAFITRVGLCDGALVVIGSGDPLLGNKENGLRGGNRQAPVIREIVLRLKSRGIESVSDILLDTSVFDEQRVHPGWPVEQLHQKYACELSGLNYNGNCVDITAVNEGGRVALFLDPPTPYVNLVNGVKVGTRRKNWFSVARTEVPNRFLVQGYCGRKAGPYSVAVENPAVFFGCLLRDSLQSAGIGVKGEVLERRLPGNGRFLPLVEFRTNITECLDRINKDSYGLPAEALLKTLSARARPEGKRGSWPSGRDVLGEYVSGLGVPRGEFAIADGSGLCRDNRLSANALVTVLFHMAAGPYWELFKSSLAVGGIKGTIENHFWETKYRGRVQAKSGYIHAVRALSGVVRTDSGDLIFSFLANKGGNGARAAIHGAVKALADWGGSAVRRGGKS